MTRTPPELSELKATLAGSLAEQSGLLFAILYGSAAEDRPFRDLDVAVYVDRDLVPPAADLDYAFELADTLEAAVSYPVDVRVVNDAPLPFTYNVTKGDVLFARDDELVANFRERTWDLYLDFKPVLMAYFYEVAREDST